MAERSVGEVPGGTRTGEGTRIAVTIRYFAAARAAAGVNEEQLSMSTGLSAQGISGHHGPGDLVNVSAAYCTVGDLLDVSAERHGPGLARVLARCSFLLDEIAVHGRKTPVLDGQVLDILPPFAGG